MEVFRPAREAELNEIADLFTNSFNSYPLFPILLGNDEEVKKHLLSMNEINTNVHFKKSHSLVAVSA